MKAHIIAIITGGGSGSRMGLTYPKQFHGLNGVPILARTLRVFQNSALIDEIIVVTPETHLEITGNLVRDYGIDKVRDITPGGRERQDSVKAGLNLVPEGTGLVVVHDAVRPLVSPELIEHCINAASVNRAAIAALPVHDTIKEAEGDLFIGKTIDRSRLWRAQTPQVAEPELLKEALKVAEEEAFAATDEAALLEQIGVKVKLVKGLARNLKLTGPEDLSLAEALIMEQENKKKERSSPSLRIGQGYDAHRLVEGRKLVLGGVTIPHPLGLLGHSDADVLTHALCDAILGALGQGDIGRYFPDSDPAYKNISSLKLLEEVTGMAAAKDYHLVNCDLTIVSQEPRLSPWFEAMRENLAASCGVESKIINLKATTTEKMGFTGRGEGVSAFAVVLLQSA